MEAAQRVKAPDPRVHEYYEEKELRDIVKSLNVPVNDDDVRRELRQSGIPVELPRETKAQRRARLVKYLAESAKQNASRGDKTDANTLPQQEQGPTITEGTPNLLAARERIAQFTNEFRSRVSAASSPLDSAQVGAIELWVSQSGFQRPISTVKFVPNKEQVIVGDWSGTISLLNVNESMSFVSERHCEQQLSALDTTSMGSKVMIASGHIDGSILLHTANFDCEASRLQGPEGRVSSLAFHPDGSHLISASHDKRWRLWDLHTEQCLLDQAGHKQAVTAIDICADGALLASTGIDRSAKIWDLRSGVLAINLEGHANGVSSVAWNPATHNADLNLATGGMDNTCAIWDLRNTAEPKKTVYAHTNAISDIKYTASGNLMVTSSLDGKLKLWDVEQTYKLVKVADAGSKLMSIDVCSIDYSSPIIAAGRWDRMLDIYKR